MMSDTSDDTNVLAVQPGPISPGYPTAGAVLDGRSGRRQPWSPDPTLSPRTSFAPISLPSRTLDLLSLDAGSFILFQLDKRELANQLHIPEDSELFEHCLAFPVKQYVGLVTGTFCGGSDSGEMIHTIAFVSKSLPPDSGHGRSPSSVPIITTRKQEQLDELPSLYLGLFPWTGCYQYTVLGTMVVPMSTHPSAIEYKLDEADFEEFDNLVTKAYTELASQRDITTPDEEVLLFEKMVPGNGILLPVEVWQELTAVQECSDPREFVEEVSHFRVLALSNAEELGY